MNQSISKFLRQPCSCLGSNENCFKCGGWGYIDDISKGRSMPTAHGGEVGQKSSFSAQGARQVSQSLPMPSKKIRTIFVKPISLKFGPTLKPKPTTICSICGVVVTKIKKHMSRVHSEEKQSNRLQLLSRKSRSPSFANVLTAHRLYVRID